MSIVIQTGKTILNGIYTVYKALPTNPKKIVYLSRQSDEPGVDFLLLDEEVKKIDPKIQSVFLCKSFDGGLLKKISYGINLLGPQMFHLATAKVAVLDSYLFSVSMLTHKKDLKVIQIWHAMGALKKFSKSIIGMKEGRSKEIAESLDMHKNYDVVLASSEISTDYFAEAFGYGKDSFITGALPRVDLLKNEDYIQRKRNEIIEKHPELIGKKVILYAPTIRRTDEDIEKTIELMEEVSRHEDFILIVSPHPVKKEPYRGIKGINILDFNTFELLTLCDFFVSDYSATIYEAAIIGKPIFLYAYDYDQYTDNRGFYLDYPTEMPNEPKASAEEIVSMIVNGEWDKERVSEFADRFVLDRGNNTSFLAKQIIALMES